MKKSIRITTPQIVLGLLAVVLLACGLAAYFGDTLSKRVFLCLCGKASLRGGTVDRYPRHADLHGHRKQHESPGSHVLQL